MTDQESLAAWLDSVMAFDPVRAAEELEAIPAYRSPVKDPYPVEASPPPPSPTTAGFTAPTVAGHSAEGHLVLVPSAGSTWPLRLPDSAVAWEEASLTTRRVLDAQGGFSMLDIAGRELRVETRAADPLASIQLHVVGMAELAVSPTERLAREDVVLRINGPTVVQGFTMRATGRRPDDLVRDRPLTKEQLANFLRLPPSDSHPITISS